MQMYVRNGRRPFAKFNKEHVKRNQLSTLRKSEWLENTPIYWNGPASGAVLFEGVLGTCLPAAIRSNFAQKPAGFYFINGSKGLAEAGKLEASDLSSAVHYLGLAENAGACLRIIQKRRALIVLLAESLREENSGGWQRIPNCWFIDGKRVVVPQVFGSFPEFHGAALMHYGLTASEPDLKAFSDALALLDAEISGDESRNSLWYFATQSAAMIGDPETPLQLLAWARTCRNGENREIGAEWLARWLEHRRWEPQSLKRFLQLLQSRGSRILRYAQRTPPESLWKLPDLLDLRFADLLLVMEYNLIDFAERFHENRGGLLLLLRLAMKSKKQWNQLSPEDRQRWVELHETTQDATLLERISRWFVELRSIDLKSAGELVEHILNSLGRKSPSRKLREAFLLERFDLLDFVLRETRWVKETHYCNKARAAYLWDSNFDFVEMCYRWWQCKWPEKLEGVLLDWLRRKYAEGIRRDGYPGYPLWRARKNGSLWCILSKGDPKQLISLIEARSEPWRLPDDPYHGWLFLRAYPSIQQFLLETCQDTTWLRVVSRLLGRLARGMRLLRCAELHRSFRQWSEIESHPEPLGRLTLFREMAGMEKPLSSALQRICTRRDRLEKELTVLKRKLSQGHLCEHGIVHLRKVQALLSDPKALADWVEKDTKKAVAKEMPKLKLEALARITRDAVRAHWKELAVGERNWRDWDNALRFYYSARENKSLMKKVLYYSGIKSSDWRVKYPTNARFLEALRANGIDAQVWLDDYCEKARIGDDCGELIVEQDPLRILQMGNFFDTWLGAEECYAFSAIANAVELNKRVLYLKDCDGCVIGRKLIGLTSVGKLIGFRSYGAVSIRRFWRMESPRVWIKLHFDLACLRLADRVGGKLESSDSDEVADELRLGAEWHNDGPEAFDWWVVRGICSAIY